MQIQSGRTVPLKLFKNRGWMGSKTESLPQIVHRCYWKRGLRMLCHLRYSMELSIWRNVVDRHRFDADPNPDPNFHVYSIRIRIFMFIQIRIRIGIDTMPIHMGILPKFYTCLENLNIFIFYFYSQHCQLTCFIFLISAKCAIISFSVFLTQYWKVFEKKLSFSTFSFAWIRIRSNDVDPTRSGS